MNTIREIFEKRAEQFNGHDPWRYGGELSEKCDVIELDWIFKNIWFKLDDIVLDAGCGTGRHILELAPKTNCKCIYGCDFVQKNIDFIKKQIEINKLKNVKVECCDGKLFNLIFPGIRFDKIFMIGFTQYIIEDDKLQIFSKHCYDCLNPGGLLILKHPLSFSETFLFDGYSNFLQSRYISKYRNFNDMNYLFKEFELIKMDRIFTQENLQEQLPVVETSERTKQMWMVFKKLI